MKVNFSGNVSAQKAPGEVVTVLIALPDGSTDEQIGTTLADGTYATVAKDYPIGGQYTFLASIPSDGKYKAASATGIFEILEDRTLTVQANLVD